jgi:energy-coupling factor transporter ATP-binding protein EcfA2
MIERVRFENFKSLADTTVALQPFTLIVGGNGSGKSSILQGLHDVLQVVSAGPRQINVSKPASVFAGRHHPARIGRPNPNNYFEIECFGAIFGSFGLRANMVADSNSRFLLWRESATGRQEIAYPGTEGKEESTFFAPLVQAGLGSVVYLRIDAKTAAEPHYSEDEEARVEFDGYGLPSVLQRLQLLRDGRFEAIETALARVVPSVKRLRAVPHKVRRPERMRIDVDGSENWVDQVRERTGTRLEAEVTGGGWIPADLLSEGTVLTLTLLTVLHDKVPRTLLLDDLDQALHPSAQGRLMAELRSVLANHPQVQVVATSHSPFAVDHAAIEEVRVVRLGSDGASSCRALGDHPKWAKRSGFMKPGEFWTGVGEDWVGG